MPIKIAIAAESAEHERRVAIEPGVLKKLQAQGASVSALKGSTASAGFNPDEFVDVVWEESEQALYQNADVVFSVQVPSAATIALIPETATLMGTLTPFKNPELIDGRNLWTFYPLKLR